MIKLLKLDDVTVNYQYYTESIKIVNIYDKVIQNINSWQTSALDQLRSTVIILVPLS